MNYPVSDPSWVIASIAHTAGIGSVEAALGMASLLGGVAGPGASILGPVGEYIHPGLNLIVAGSDSPGWNRAQDLLLAPLAASQRMFRDLSHSASLERLDWHQHGYRKRGETDAIVEACKSGILNDFDMVTRSVPSDRHFASLRHPSFLLHSPNPGQFSQAMDEVLDHCALIVYPEGQLLSELTRKRPSKKWQALAAQIAATTSGTDQVFNPEETQGPGRIDTATAHLFMTCSHAELREALVSDHPNLQRLLRSAVTIDVAAADGPESVDQEALRYGYRAFYESVKRILNARRISTGLKWGAKDQTAVPALHALEMEIQDWVARLPDNIQPFFREAQFLPHRLLWTVACTLGRSETRNSAMPFICHVTQVTLERQAGLLTELMGTAEQSEHERARLVMLRKLEQRPRIFRDLLRTYSVQRSDVHQPILNELVHEGLIQLRSDGLLELSPEGHRRVA